MEFQGSPPCPNSIFTGLGIPKEEPAELLRHEGVRGGREAGSAKARRSGSGHVDQWAVLHAEPWFGVVGVLGAGLGWVLGRFKLGLR